MRIVTRKDASHVLGKLTQRKTGGSVRVENLVRRIVRDVKKDGNAALLRYAARFDNLDASEPIRVSQAELKRAWRDIPKSFRDALLLAAKRIRQFAIWQKPRSWRRDITPGVTVGQLVRPLESVGCYIPAGRHPLPSTLLMTVIPAQVAGVLRIAVVSPRPTREILAAAAMLGVKEFYRVGGAQAIAAMAYGTKALPRVDKIVGPGNHYVTAAKKLVGFDCSIDMLAGPTEVVIYSDGGRPSFIAADLVAQAEHDSASVAVFVTTKRSLAQEVCREVRRQAKGNATAESALQRNGFIFVARSRFEALATVNAIAPEHVTVNGRDAASIRHAGSIFVGSYSAQPAGDYCTGPNHVLPTGATARWRGGLNVCDFVKIITIQKLSRQGIGRVGDTAVRLAEAEGLSAHVEAIRLRRGKQIASRGHYV